MRMNAPQSLQLSDPINSYLFIYLFWRANLLICDTFINAKFGIKTSDVLSMETAKLTIDPNRQSLENKLRERVRQTILKNKKKISQ